MRVTREELSKRESIFRAADTFDTLINALLNQSREVVEQRCTKIPTIEEENGSYISYETSITTNESSTIYEMPVYKAKKKKCKLCGEVMTPK